MDNPIKDPSLDATHVSATIALPSTNNQEKPKIVNDSSDTISSPVKKDSLDNLNAPTNNLVVQENNKSLVNRKALKLGMEEKGLLLTRISRSWKTCPMFWRRASRSSQSSPLRWLMRLPPLSSCWKMCRRRRAWGRRTQSFSIDSLLKIGPRCSWLGKERKKIPVNGLLVSGVFWYSAGFHYPSFGDGFAFLCSTSLWAIGATMQRLPICILINC